MRAPWRWLAVVALAALVPLAACGRAAPSLQSTWDAARNALWRGDLTTAQALADQAVSRTRSAPESADAWQSALLRAEIQLARLDLAAAAPALAATLPSGSAFDALRSRQRYLSAKAFVIRGSLPQALDAIDEAVRLAPDEGPLRVDIGVLAGQVLLRLSRWDEAEADLRETLARAERANNRYRQALALTNLGMARLVRSRWDEALPFFDGVLSLHELEPFTAYAGALTNVGICYSRLGQFDRAVPIQQRAVAIYERRGIRSDYERALGELGNTYLLQGDTDDGRRYLQQALDVATASKIPADAALWAGNLASEYLDVGDWDRAESLNARALQIRSASRTANVVHNTLNAARIAQGRLQLANAAELYRAALAGAGDEASVRWDAHRGLGEVALASGRPDEATKEFEAALAVIDHTRAGLLKVDYKLSYLTRLIGFYASYIDTLIAQGQTMRALEVADSSRARVLSEGQGVDAPPGAPAAAFQRAAREQHTTIAFYWLAKRSYLWVVTSAAIRCVPLPPAATIDALVRQQQQAIANGLGDPLAHSNAAGRELYRLLVEPFARELRPGASVVIVPDGSLAALNFETLPVDGRSGSHYWIEDVQLAVAPSIGLLTEPARARRLDSLLVVGNAAAHDPDFPALRYAAPEMTAVARHFDGGREVVYAGDEASPARYRASQPERFDLIHFTAHAEPNAASPLDSAVVLSGPPGAFKLYARDVADHPLRAELVTISGCRSAGDREYSGEGLVGFAWAFLRAGAHNVIAGLWDVDDQSTVDLMDALYARLAAGAGPEDALRSAKLLLIRRGGRLAKPYYWATFQLFTRAPS